MAGQLRANRKATVIQRATHYYRGMQKSISELKIHQTLVVDGLQ